MHTNRPNNPQQNPDPGNTRQEPGRENPLQPGGPVENPSDTPTPGTPPNQPVS